VLELCVYGINSIIVLPGLRMSYADCYDLQSNAHYEAVDDDFRLRVLPLTLTFKLTCHTTCFATWLMANKLVAPQRKVRQFCAAEKSGVDAFALTASTNPLWRTWRT